MLTNPRSATAKSVAKLAQRARRAESGLFLIEGPHAIIEAVTHKPDRLERVYATAAALEAEPELAHALADAKIEPVLATDDVLAAMATTVNPQPIVATCRQFPAAAHRLLDDPSLRLIAVLHEVRDPGNVGTIIRTADAAGADAVILTGSSVDPFGPKAVRASTGSLFHLPVALGADLAEVCARLRSTGVQVWATDAGGEDLLELRRSGALAGPTAWLFGNEARGLADAERGLADRCVSIPLFGAAESLNLSTAAAVCLYESAFAHFEHPGSAR